MLGQLKRESLNLIWRRKLKSSLEEMTHKETRTESESAGWWWGWNPCRGSGRRGCIVWAIEGGGQLWRSRGGKACGTKVASARPTQEPPLCADEEIGPFFHGTWAKNNLFSRFFFFLAIPRSTWYLSPPIRIEPKTSVVEHEVLTPGPPGISQGVELEGGPGPGISLLIVTQGHVHTAKPLPSVGFSLCKKSVCL